jgi:hypothetical protein
MYQIKLVLMDDSYSCEVRSRSFGRDLSLFTRNSIVLRLSQEVVIGSNFEPLESRTRLLHSVFESHSNVAFYLLLFVLGKTKFLSDLSGRRMALV